tara:strand:+ start:36734 stop:36925 length:192 start_codon:yes stop_codon:yes gene_type:complete
MGLRSVSVLKTVREMGTKVIYAKFAEMARNFGIGINNFSYCRLVYRLERLVSALESSRSRGIF